ncbi:MAG: hypothetical protein ACLP9D_12830 [Candidatus Bathyarchaeia archaeon]
MPEEKRKQLRAPETNAIQQDFQRTVADLSQGKIPEELITKKRIVKTPDSETTVEYELKIDQSTGQQYVEERWTTTKQECAICGRFTSQTRACDFCGNKVCGQCLRSYKPYSSSYMTCKSCFDSRIQQAKGQ